MFKVFQYLQALLNNRVTLLAFYMGDKPDTAGIVFIGRVV
jgi:hypothetical protein